MAARVCHVLTSFEAGGATESAFLRVLGGNQENRYFFAGGKANRRFPLLETRLREKGVVFLELGALSNNAGPLNDFIAVMELRQFFIKNRIEVVHTHNTKGGVLGRIAAVLAGVGRIVHEVDGMPVTESKVMEAAYFFIENLLSRKTHAFLFVSENLRSGFCRHAAIPPEKTFFVPTAMELPTSTGRANFRKRLGLNDGAFGVGMIGRLDRLKRYDLFLDVAQKVLERGVAARFFIIGDGPERNSLEELANAKGLSGRLSFTGFVQPSALPDMINALDVVLHTSEKEGIPRTILQAMCLGKPVVCFDAGEISEVVSDNTTGMLANFGNTSAAAGKVVQLIQKPEDRKRIGSTAKKAVAGFFKPEEHAILVEKIYSRGI